ncbi:efflux RND transporter periplasmic adaptor subunit [Persicobacter diffluens]|uniref:Hemolysin D n=1 Tax=Persicobacter diffluens TaxID=981 RepID=A0AAN4W1A9_9BACT|nr:hemolysin D [Persicobacter diffluens]
MKSYHLYILSSLFFAMACKGSKEDKQPVQLQSLAPQLKTTQVKLQIPQTSNHFTGKVEPLPDQELEIPSMFPGKVEQVNVNVGEQVAKGQVLATIRSSEMAELSKDLLSAQYEVRKEEKEYALTKDLYEAGMASEKDLIVADGELRSAQAEVLRMEQMLQILGDADGGIQKIKAPISGIITERNLKRNMLIGEDFDAPLFVVADLSEVYVSLNIYESDIRKIALGQEVKLSSISYPDETFTGKISQFVRVLDEETKVMKAKVKLENGDFLLMPQMFMDAYVVRKGDQPLATVPSSAIIFEDNQHYVITKSGAQCQKQPVQLWGEHQDKAFIQSGLQAEEEVVISYPLMVYNHLLKEEKFGNQ